MRASYATVGESQTNSQVAVISAQPPAAGVPVPVESVEDTEANAPLLAHIQYWTNRRLRETLYEAIITL